MPKSPTFLGNFCKALKIYNFSSEIIFGQLLWTFGDFSGHTATYLHFSLSLPLPYSLYMPHTNALLWTLVSTFHALILSFSDTPSTCISSYPKFVNIAACTMRVKWSERWLHDGKGLGFEYRYQLILVRVNVNEKGPQMDILKQTFFFSAYFTINVTIPAYSIVK